MHQQLPHVVGAFLHPQVNFIQDLLHLRCVLVSQGMPQQGHLDAQERQGLGDRIVQFPRQHRALLAHCGLPQQGIGAQVFHRIGQMTCQGVVQVPVLCGQRHRITVKQIHLTQDTLLQADGHAHQRTIPNASAQAMALVAFRDDGNDARTCAGLGLTTGTQARFDAPLLTHDFIGQTVAGQQQVALTGFIRPTHRHRIGPADAAHLLRKALRQPFQAVGFHEKVADLIKR